MTKKFFLYAIAALGTLQSAAAQPRLIVQIVVGSMRGEDLDRYAENFGEGGFRRLTEGGTVYADSRYDYLQTTTPVSLATLTTGAMPSTHGVIGSRWVDYTTNRTVELTAGRKGPGAYHLIAPTLAETLLRHAPGQPRRHDRPGGRFGRGDGRARRRGVLARLGALRLGDLALLRRRSARMDRPQQP